MVKDRCYCLKDGVHGGERVRAGKYYVYYKPRGFASNYYTLYEEDLIRSKYICSIHVHQDDFVKVFEVVLSDLVIVDNMFNDIMDGKCFM